MATARLIAFDSPTLPPRRPIASTTPTGTRIALRAPTVVPLRGYTAAMHAALDHLVVVCADLAQGSAWAERVLGVRPQAGGRHATMGTHNRLLRLGPQCYLELIALDPEGTTPARPRWFALDEPAVRARAAGEPFLHTWVAASDDLDAALGVVPALGEALPFARGDLSWRFALRPDGALNFDGMLPALIQWRGARHPCDGLPPCGVALHALTVTHPRAAELQRAFAALGMDTAVRVDAGPPRLCAHLATPRGALTLVSPPRPLA
jgi:hypothetical protein